MIKYSSRQIRAQRRQHDADANEAINWGCAGLYGVVARVDILNPSITDATGLQSNAQTEGRGVASDGSDPGPPLGAHVRGVPGGYTASGAEGGGWRHAPFMQRWRAPLNYCPLAVPPPSLYFSVQISQETAVGGR